MEKFVACICENDINQLVVEGNPTAEELFEAWGQLFLEYCDLAEHTEVRYKFRLKMEVTCMKARIETAEACVHYLRVANDCRATMPNTPRNGFIQCLKDIGFDYELDFNDEGQFMKDLRRIEAELMPEGLRLKAKEMEMESIQNSSTDSEAVERKYFITIFNRINNYCKREAVNMQTTVEMYCASLRDYVAALETSNIV
jgi:hypothetical protein